MKKTMKFILIASIAAIGSVKAQVPAVITSDKTGWHKISETTVDFKNERDEVTIMGADRFAAIQFKVEDAPINLISLEVFYESGDKQDIVVRTPIKAHGESRIIDLKGGERNLKKIAFVYKTIPNSKDQKAHVEIWGLKTNTNEKNTITGSTTPQPSIIMSDKKGWHQIGSRSVDFVRDRDEILVLGADRFSAIQFRVTEASIQLMNLEVYYESGDKQNIDVNSPIMAGEDSKVINLNGGERSLKKIVFVYKTIPNQTAEKATVEVWGLKTNIASK